MIQSPPENYNDALTFFQKELDLKQQTGQISEIERLIYAISEIYYQQGCLNQALKYLNILIEVLEQTNREKGTFTYIFHFIGNIYRDLGDLTKATDFYEKCLESLDTTLHPMAIAKLLVDYAHVKQVQESLNYEDPILSRFPSPPHDSPVIKALYQMLNGILAEVGMYTGFAELGWELGSKSMDLDLVYQIKCHKSLVNWGIRRFNDQPTKPFLLNAIQKRLDEWENLTRAHKLAPSYCEVTIIKSKLLLFNLEISNAEKLLQNSINAAKAKGLPLHYKLAGLELKKLKNIDPVALKSASNENIAQYRSQIMKDLQNTLNNFEKVLNKFSG
ncbi:MAG: tetratricopeptide repeat protein [Candidatus Hodarchaeales archaeon]|jgi:tetratricopeptide (TPR) repeat protein